ncbi:MAG: sulfur carrier protein ThiS [Planctomycetes bacterium]|nr:sulfur carrier protein ThiS [Planctomycetota bacterium]
MDEPKQGGQLPITVNGTPRLCPAGSTVADLVAALGLWPQQVAVERNKQIVRAAERAATLLAAGDRLEVVTFFGGG